MVILYSCESGNSDARSGARKNLYSDIVSGTGLIIPDSNRYNFNVNVNVKANRVMYTSDFINMDSSYLIYLETKEDNLIGSIDKLIFWSDRIIILDKKIVNGFFIFDTKGKFIKKVASIGRGFAEYNQITDITINKEDSLIVVYDHTSKKAMFFNLEGDFYNEKKVNEYYQNIAFYPGNKYLAYCESSVSTVNNKHFSLVLLDSNFSVITGLLETPNGLRVNTMANLYENSNGVYLISPYYNNIVLFDNQNKFYSFANLKTTAGSQIDYDFLSGITNLSVSEQLKAIRKTSMVNCIMDLQVNKSKILFTYAWEKTRNSVLFDLNTKKTISCNGLFSDDLFMSSINYWPLASFDNCWVFPLYPGSIVTGYNRSVVTNKKNRVSRAVIDTSLSRYNNLLYSIATKAKEDDNPVLLVAGLKSL